MPVTVVASATSSTQLLPADSGRSSVIISNDDPNRLFVLLDDAAVTASSYSFSLGQYENARVTGAEAQGRIMGIWAGDGAGNAYVTTRS